MSRWEDCGSLCAEKNSCQFWVWSSPRAGRAGTCALLDGFGTRMFDPKAVAGRADCRGQQGWANILRLQAGYFQAHHHPPDQTLQTPGQRHDQILEDGGQTLDQHHDQTPGQPHLPEAEGQTPEPNRPGVQLEPSTGYPGMRRPGSGWFLSSPWWQDLLTP